MSENPTAFGRSEMIAAARALLERLDTITTEEFARGGEREERERLRAALAALPGGDPAPRPGRQRGES